MSTQPWVARHWKWQGLGLPLFVFLSVFPAAFHWQEHLSVILLVAAMVVAIAQRRPFWIRTPIDLPLALLAGWILLTIPFSSDPAYSLAEWRKLIEYMLVFYWVLLVLHNNSDTDCWRYVIRAMLVGVSTISLYGIWNFVQDGGTLVDRSVQAVGPSSWPSAFGAYLAIALPFVGVCYAWSKDRAKTVGWDGVGCLLLCVIFLSYSRAAWLASMVIASGFWALRNNRGLVVWGGVSLVISVVFVMIQVYLGDIWVFAVNGPVFGRLQCWQLGLSELINHPLVGVGFGNDIFKSLCKITHLHNTFLMYAAGSGAPALIFLLWTFVAIIMTLTRDVRAGRFDEVALVTMAGALMVAGYMVTMSFDYLFSGSLSHLFWILVAVCMFLSREEQRPAHEMSRVGWAPCAVPHRATLFASARESRAGWGSRMIARP